MKARLKEIIDNRWLIFALRVVLGGIFIAASIGKLQNHAEFINTVTGYAILPDSLAQVYGLVLPWVELFIGCTLVLGVFSRFASILSIPVIISFIIASTYNLFHSLGESCGCFGPLIQLSHPVALAIDAVMLLMVVQLLLHKTRTQFLSIGLLLRQRYSLEGRSGVVLEKAGKAAVVVLAMVAVIYSTGVAQGSLNTEPSSTPGVDEGVQGMLNTEIDSALESGKLAFLFFYQGCSCAFKSQFAIIDHLEWEYNDSITFIRINYEKEPQAEKEFNIETSPTMLLITGKDDKGKYIVYQRFEENIDEEMLKDSFEQALRDEPR